MWFLAWVSSDQYPLAPGSVSTDMPTYRALSFVEPRPVFEFAIIFLLQDLDFVRGFCYVYVCF